MGIFTDKATALEVEAKAHIAKAKAALDELEKALTGEADKVLADVIPNLSLIHIYPNNFPYP